MVVPDTMLLCFTVGYTNLRNATNLTSNYKLNLKLFFEGFHSYEALYIDT